MAERDLVHGKNVLLVDDVMTTGATLDACSFALLKAGASAVYCVTVAGFSKDVPDPYSSR
jgi:predicted amidophosphoribosyltransferase